MDAAVDAMHRLEARPRVEISTRVEHHVEPDWRRSWSIRVDGRVIRSREIRRGQWCGVRAVASAYREVFVGPPAGAYPADRVAQLLAEVLAELADQVLEEARYREDLSVEDLDALRRVLPLPEAA